MNRCAPIVLVAVIGLAAACARSPEPSSPPASTPADAAAGSSHPGNAAADSSAPPAALDVVPGQLAVALEGDVKHLGDTRYEAIGPELKCSAMLLPDDGGPVQPASSLVEWKVEPAGAGTFSIGAQGAYFLPSSAGTVTIYAELVGGSGPRRSPGLSLSVSSPGPAPAG